MTLSRRAATRHRLSPVRAFTPVFDVLWGEGKQASQYRMSVISSIRSQLAPIHPAGYPFIGGFALASLVLFIWWAPLGWLGTVATLWCAYFFRDPVRVTPIAEGLVVSPADGRVS